MLNSLKVVQINSTCGAGSTGKICVAVSNLLSKYNIENYIFYTSEDSNYPLGIRYMSFPEIKFQALKSRIFGNYGFQSKIATKKLIKKLDRICPDIVHLHNLHSHNINLEILFKYLKDKKIKIIWTFHDCWAFTGYCPHYSMIGCYEWRKKGCNNCPQLKRYSWFFDNSGKNFFAKKELMKDAGMMIITPSVWLENQVKQSFLKQSEIKVINNGIDLSVFQHRESDFRQKYNLKDEFVVLGVAFDWSKRKGLDVFINLSKRLSDKFQIVLVGTDKHIDKTLPPNIISIHRTANQRELAEIYSAADLFVNPTREEVFGLVNIEALACGTPVVTFNTGGSPECIDEKTGMVVECDDENALVEAILDIEKNRPFRAEDCIERAKQFDEIAKYQEYLDLYVEINK